MYAVARKVHQKVGFSLVGTVRLSNMGRRGHIDPQSPPAIARRLRALRGALNKTQKEMTQLLGSGNRGQKWANYEASAPHLWRRIGLDSALRLCQETDVTLEWIYRGDTRWMPPDLLQKIRDWDHSHRDFSL